MMDYTGPIKEGYYLRVEDPATPGKRDFAMVIKREPAYYLYKWGTDVAVGGEDGPVTVENIRPLALNTIEQCWFGIRGGCYIYLSIPTNARLMGTGPSPQATSALREVGWWTEDSSPFWDPNPATEFFLMKGGNFEFPAFTAFNNTFRARRVQLRIVINKLSVVPVTDQAIRTALGQGRIPSRPVNFGGLGASRSGPG